MENIVLYIKESYNELINHVAWPSWNDLYNSAVLVVVGTIILSLIVFIFDLISNQGLGLIYNIN